ncbi:MAG: hypothetical protein K6T31_04900, partial [Alicyclobacillus sp.]|nr:hypothetical protein [Alicyclobacillus sp.]
MTIAASWYTGKGFVHGPESCGPSGGHAVHAKGGMGVNKALLVLDVQDDFLRNTLDYIAPL